MTETAAAFSVLPPLALALDACVNSICFCGLKCTLLLKLVKFEVIFWFTDPIIWPCAVAAGAAAIAIAFLL